MKFHGKDILNWSINDYLGLQTTLKCKADADAALEYGAAYPWCSHDEWSYFHYEQLENELVFVQKNLLIY
jgi:glycine C-acetyltransferase